MHNDIHGHVFCMSNNFIIISQVPSSSTLWIILGITAPVSSFAVIVCLVLIILITVVIVRKYRRIKVRPILFFYLHDLRLVKESTLWHFIP